MQKRIKHLMIGISMALFGLVCLVTAPIIMFNFGAICIGSLIKSQWPDSQRAREVAYWLKVLAPLLLSMVLAIVIGFAVAHLNAIKQATNERARIVSE